MSVPAAFTRMMRSVGQLATTGSAPRVRILVRMKEQFRVRLKYQFSHGVDPDDLTYDLTVRRKLALISNKLPNAFRFWINGDSLSTEGRVPRGWLDAHQRGWKFPPRHVARGGSATHDVTKWRRDGSSYEKTIRPGVMLFDKKGRLVSHRRGLAHENGKNMRFGRATFARAHTVGERVLPQRMLVPDAGTLPAPWAAAAAAGFALGMADWAAKVDK